MIKFTSTAVTAYDRLVEIARLILEEPKRYNQSDTLTIIGSQEQPCSGLGTSFYGNNIPDCGMIGCVAGWDQVLEGGLIRKVSFDLIGKEWAHPSYPVDFVRIHLGLNAYQTTRLVESDAVIGIRQTLEYAVDGAIHILKFAKDFQGQLQQTKLADTRKELIKQGYQLS